jgi:hypothetical protein
MHCQRKQCNWPAFATLWYFLSQPPLLHGFPWNNSANLSSRPVFTMRQEEEAAALAAVLFVRGAGKHSLELALSWASGACHKAASQPNAHPHHPSSCLRTPSTTCTGHCLHQGLLESTRAFGTQCIKRSSKQGTPALTRCLTFAGCFRTPLFCSLYCHI